MERICYIFVLFNTWDLLCMGILNKLQSIVQSDRKENKSEQALQIIGHVVAESYANKRSMHGRIQFVVSNTTF
jgi:hypothetical protein